MKQFVKEVGIAALTVALEEGTKFVVKILKSKRSN